MVCAPREDRVAQRAERNAVHSIPVEALHQHSAFLIGLYPRVFKAQAVCTGGTTDCNKDTFR